MKKDCCKHNRAAERSETKNKPNNNKMHAYKHFSLTLPSQIRTVDQSSHHRHPPPPPPYHGPWTQIWNLTHFLMTYPEQRVATEKEKEENEKWKNEKYVRCVRTYIRTVIRYRKMVIIILYHVQISQCCIILLCREYYHVGKYDMKYLTVNNRDGDLYGL